MLWDRMGWDGWMVWDMDMFMRITITNLDIRNTYWMDGRQDDEHDRQLMRKIQLHNVCIRISFIKQQKIPIGLGVYFPSVYIVIFPFSKRKDET